MNTNLSSNFIISETEKFTEEFIITLILVCGLILLILITLLFASNLTPSQQSININNTFSNKDFREIEGTAIPLFSKSPDHKNVSLSGNVMANNAFLGTINTEQSELLRQSTWLTNGYQDSEIYHNNKRYYGSETLQPALLTMNAGGRVIKMPALQAPAGYVFTSRGLPVHYNTDGTMDVFAFSRDFSAKALKGMKNHPSAGPSGGSSQGDGSGASSTGEWRSATRGRYTLNPNLEVK